MPTFDEAIAMIERAITPLGPETVALDDAAGRWLAAPLAARYDAPRRDCSIMDGYAVSAATIATGEWLPCVGEVRAGELPSVELKPSEAMRIFTGAFLPAGADCVIMQEYAEIEGNRVRFREGFGPSSHVRTAGSDFRKGDVLVEAGRRLTPQAMVAAAAADHSECEVSRRPRVAIIATGDELVPPGQAAAGEATQADSASFGVAALARAAGAQVVSVVRGGDEIEGLTRFAGDALAQADCVVVTGGASVGAYDLARPMFAKHGLEEIFSRLPIRPGRPVWFGMARGCCVLGLPGNPTSAMVTARLFLKPLLACLQGGTAGAELQFLPMCLGSELAATGSRETFVRARATSEGLVPLTNQLSGAQSPLAQADWLIRCQAEAGARLRGELVYALPF
ncbi:molybdopterin molybdotransferase MoeA [Qipengyuania sp. XHP0207]|uniref:molybdopterin molybdotransferase MoeA n=1 Tax=Qipengyuania sp. XHP0207 TaxID=3038078 RepID=UPI00241D725D|nr:molybdopterin molybdotransferase MoeA [Qipengyuania sp. XHP0207]MDG5746935.1 molybdopterin molybdotransferase MoeA [Qipengyuania sp. XHP0207]